MQYLLRHDLTVQSWFRNLSVLRGFADKNLFSSLPFLEILKRVGNVFQKKKIHSKNKYQDFVTKIKKKGSMACLEIFSGKLEAYHIIVWTCPSKDVTKYSRVCELSILLTRKKGYHVWGESSATLHYFRNRVVGNDIPPYQNKRKDVKGKWITWH